MPKKKLPRWIQGPVAGALRAATTPITVLGLRRSLDAARALGAAYPRLQPSRFQRAVKNLSDAFPDWLEQRTHDTAVACYQHLFQLGVEFMYTPRLINAEGFTSHIYFAELVPAISALLSGRPCILITGHVGNWELVGYTVSMIGFPMHAVYRPLDLEPLDHWVRETRRRRGLSLVNKFGAVRALPPILRAGHPVGLVADQSGGDRGLFTPFFGRLTSTYKSIGLLAMQTDATVVCGYARRMADHEPPPPGAAHDWHQGLRYTVELVDHFGPDDWKANPDPLFYLTARYRRAIELMVRRSPEQYFWMHRIWRSRPAHERLGKPFPPSLRDKLRSLPWLSEPDVEAIVERSDRDAAEWAVRQAP